MIEVSRCGLIRGKTVQHKVCLANFVQGARATIHNFQVHVSLPRRRSCRTQSTVQCCSATNDKQQFRFLLDSSSCTEVIGILAMQRKDEILAKKAKLAELRRQREEREQRQKEYAKRDSAIGTPDVIFSSVYVNWLID